MPRPEDHVPIPPELEEKLRGNIIPTTPDMYDWEPVAFGIYPRWQRPFRRFLYWLHRGRAV